jgi:hypothetical protein|tara:strand:+ start:234 stop:452 length:219 start_codon:yes stop_codon:yes gene_type:complete
MEKNSKRSKNVIDFGFVAVKHLQSDGEREREKEQRRVQERAHAKTPRINDDESVVSPGVLYIYIFYSSYLNV